MNKKTVGKKYENLACSYLQQNGYTVLKQNYRYGKKEIDIIASTGKVLVFAEIKYRTRNRTYNAFNAVSKQKMRNIITCARGFISLYKAYRDYYSRFDVLVVIKNNNTAREVHHIKNAFSVSTVN